MPRRVVSALVDHSLDQVADALPASDAALREARH